MAKSKKQLTTKAYIGPIVIIINRFDVRCGICFKVFDNREAKICPHCKAVFTHATTDCNPTWMKSVVQALRKDLTYIPLEEIGP